MGENDKIFEALCRLEGDMTWVKKLLGNHLTHHERYLYIGLTAMLSLIGALILVLIK